MWPASRHCRIPNGRSPMPTRWRKRLRLLTGFYKIPTESAAELTLGLRDSIEVEPLALADYETSIREARSRGVMGGGIYDSLHATFARRNKAVRIVTRNPSHFQHVAPDIEN